MQGISARGVGFIDERNHRSIAIHVSPLGVQVLSLRNYHDDARS